MNSSQYSKPVITEVFACNGEHSHYKLVDTLSGAVLWEPSDEVLHHQSSPNTFCRGLCNWMSVAGCELCSVCGEIQY